MNIPMRDKEACVEDGSVNSVSLGKREKAAKREGGKISHTVY